MGDIDGLVESAAKMAIGKPVVTYVAIDTEGTSKTGLRQVGAVLLEDSDAFFFDTISPKTGQFAPGETARTWAKVGAQFWEWLRGQGDEIVLVGHNIKKHDRPLLERESMEQCPEAFLAVRDRLFVVDTLDATRALFPVDVLRDRRQVGVYAHLFGGAPPNAHSALGDARANASIAKHDLISAFIRGGARVPWVKSQKRSTRSTRE